MNYEIVRLTDRPELKEQAAVWFHEKWGIPLEAYMESMNECLKGVFISEYASFQNSLLSSDGLSRSQLISLQIIYPPDFNNRFQSFIALENPAM